MAERRFGPVGTVIQVFESTADHPAGFIIEFTDETGKVRAETDISDRTEIVKLRLKLDREAANACQSRKG